MRAWLGCVLVMGLLGCDRPPQLRPGEVVTSANVAIQAPTAAAPADAADPAATPVVVELFSSEGCSSCPPADVALSELATKQGIAGAHVIALEFHVDYWDDLGWADPFSSADFSARQRSYARAAGRRGAFTPEAVVDGRASVVGSDTLSLSSEIEGAASRPHLGVKLTARTDGSLDAIPSSAPSSPASYWLAITESGLATDVKAGENRGQTLRHAPIVRSLTRVGTVVPEATHIVLPSVRSASGGLTAVVFIQQDRDLAIVGASALPLTRTPAG